MNLNENTIEQNLQHKKKDIILWLPQHEHILKSWKAKCFVNMWLQSKSRYYYAFIQNILTYPIIIITSCSGAVLFSYQFVTINYIVGILSLIAGILMAVMRQLKPEELGHTFSMTMRKYQTLIRKIDTILDVPPHMRKMTPESCIDKITYEIDSIIDSQLYPPIQIVWEFEKTFGNLHEILYGQDIIELLKRDLENRKMIRKQLNGNENVHNPFDIVPTRSILFPCISSTPDIVIDGNNIKKKEKE